MKTYRNRMISRSNETTSSLTDDTVKTPPPGALIMTLTTLRMSVKLHLKYGVHSPRQTIPKYRKRTRISLKRRTMSRWTSMTSASLHNKLMTGLPQIVELFGDIK
jgi:hypothetical protein